MTSSLVLETSPALPRGLSHVAAKGSLAGRLYVAPAGIVAGKTAAAAVTSGQAWGLAGGGLSFSACSVLLRDGGQLIEAVAPFSDVLDWSEAEGPEVARYVGSLLTKLGKARPAFAGLDMGRPQVMGIVNVTPDSFSDGGKFFDTDRAIAHGQHLLAAGADILDIGGESTRPGADTVSPEEEISRVVPVIRALAGQGATVSVDTRHASVMGAAVEAGAAIINDITALSGDPQSLTVAAKSGAAIMLMHMQGEPGTMQKDPHYAFAPLDVYDYLEERVAVCRAAGIPASRLCIDPGIGFGKTVEHNLQILARLSLYHALGLPVLLGVSRKTFIGKLSGAPPSERLAGSLSAALVGLDQGAQILRVHDVAETIQAVAVWRGMRRA
ncbi:dihydropteroate synthase [Telmatospirillum sp.]|uniref:dihydropteroate synthase n=1 Tax=Telmatospirillum sp. TaxID=2079197 RepID=UPI002840A141|nr:dihydropteroate synthase [Telmatospirillum sp.]MDR3437950.1 dihydropteroate synthase [Telmatospirillum sp.]